MVSSRLKKAGRFRFKAVRWVEILVTWSHEGFKPLIWSKQTGYLSIGCTIMDKLDKIRAWAKDLDEPILCFVNGTDAEVIKLAKAVLEENLAEVVLLGDELEVYDQCRVYRLPESRLYGVINPQNPPDLEQMVDDYMLESGEKDRKKPCDGSKPPRIWPRICGCAVMWTGLSLKRTLFRIHRRSPKTIQNLYRC